MKISKHSDSKIEVSSMGLKIEIDPGRLLRESLSEESQNLLSDLLEAELERTLTELKKYFDKCKNPKEEKNLLYHKEKHLPLIKKLATLERELINRLHVDCGDIEMDEELNDLRSWAYSVYKYDSEYGFVGTVEKDI